MCDFLCVLLSDLRCVHVFPLFIFNDPACNGLDGHHRSPLVDQTGGNAAGISNLKKDTYWSCSFASTR